MPALSQKRPILHQPMQQIMTGATATTPSGINGPSASYPHSQSHSHSHAHSHPHSHSQLGTPTNIAAVRGLNGSASTPFNLQPLIIDDTTGGGISHAGSTTLPAGSLSTASATANISASGTASLSTPLRNLHQHSAPQQTGVHAGATANGTTGSHSPTLLSMLGKLTNYYTVNTYTAQTLPPAAQLALATEGCAECLDTDFTPGRAYDGNSSVYIVLQCPLLQCTHVLHYACMLAMHTARTLGPTSGLSVPSLTPSLDVWHGTSYFRVLPTIAFDVQQPIPLPDGNEESSLRSLSHTSAPMLGRHRTTSTRRACLLEFAFTHHISNAQQMHITMPTAIPTVTTVYSQSDDASQSSNHSTSSISGNEVLLLTTAQLANLNKKTDSAHMHQQSDVNGAHATSDHKDAHDMLDGPDGQREFAQAPCFHLLRGKIFFRCTDLSTGMIHQHAANYDLTSLTSHTATLIMVDHVSRHILCFALYRYTSSMSTWYIGAVRYEFLSASAIGIGNLYSFAPPLNYDEEITSLPLSTLTMSSMHSNTTMASPMTMPDLLGLRQQSGASVDLNFTQYESLLNPTSPPGVQQPNLSPRSQIYASQYAGAALPGPATTTDLFSYMAATANASC